MPNYMKPHIMVVSVSSDGNYAISTDLYQHAILWNLKEKKYKLVAKNINVYSAYFVKHTDDFMYQNDKSNEVIIENIKGKIIKRLNPGFPTYGEVITSDLQNYFASDDNYNIYRDNNNQIKKIYMAWRESFEGFGKLFNLNLSFDNQCLIGSGFDFIRVWCLPELKMNELHKNNAQTVAVISPDDKYVISGDANFWGYLYNLDTKEGAGFYYQIPEYPALSNYEGPYKINTLTGITAVKYIDNDHVLAFYYGIAQHTSWRIPISVSTNKIYSVSQTRT